MLIGFQAVSAKDYEIEHAHIKAVVKKNGLVSFEETRVYQFNGSFKWASFELDKRGFEKLLNVRVWEGSTLYELSDTENPGTYEIKEKSKKFVINWYYNAKDEQRTFTISYELEGALVSDEEWTELYWTFLGKNWDKRNKDVEIELAFEDSVLAYSWADGFGYENLETKENGWELKANPNSKRDVIRVKTHFQTAYLTNPSAIRGTINPQIGNDIHQEYVEEIARREAQDVVFYEIGKILFIPILLASGLVFFIFYRKNKPSFDGVNLQEKAKNLTLNPALVNCLINSGFNTAGAFKSTLMKLIFDGFIQLNVVGKETKRFYPDRPLIELIILDKPETELEYEFERELLRFLKQRAEKYTYLDDVFKKEQTKVSKWYTSWIKSLKKEYKKQDWYVLESKKDVYWNVGLQLILIILGVLVLIGLGPLGIVVLVVPLMMAAISGVIYHRNELGEAVYQRMIISKKGIKKLKKDKISPPESANWTLFLWALAFDISKEEIKWLVKDWQLNSIPNLIIDPHYDSILMPFLLDDLLMITHGAYMGSASGGGVGASAGAAGGGGGGGAG